MFSYFEPNFIEKFLWESDFSNFGQNQNRLFGRHFEMIKHSNFLSRIMVFDSPWIYSTNFIAKFRWKSGFLRSSMDPTLGTNGSESTLVP